jgi:DNA-binding transcriptional ArsR family regulator
MKWQTLPSRATILRQTRDGRDDVGGEAATYESDIGRSDVAGSRRAGRIGYLRHWGSAWRGRTTRLAILEALQLPRARQSDDLVRDDDRAERTRHRITARMIADMLHLHPTTVYGHLKQLRAQGIIE